MLNSTLCDVTKSSQISENTHRQVLVEPSETILFFLLCFQTHGKFNKAPHLAGS